MDSYADILKECVKIAEVRQEQYGEASANLEEVSSIVDQCFGLEISPAGICKVLVALKIAREKHQHSRDNLIDAANYLIILQHIYGDDES